MRWFRKKEDSLVELIDNTLKELKQEPFKALFVYNSQWLPIYSYAEESYFDGEFQEILQVMEAAQKAFEKNLKRGVLEVIMNSLKIKIPLLSFRYGSFLVMAIREEELYLVAVIDEFHGRANLDKVEKKMREKLNRILERIESR
jgi:predicted HAD superfamily Cof-like phosphohydrolase